MNKIRVSIIVAIFLFVVTPIYISAASLSEYSVSKKDYEYIEFFSAMSTNLNLLNSQTGYEMTYQIGDLETRYITYDADGLYSVDYEFNGDYYHVVLNNESDFEVTYNGTKVKYSEADYNAELELKENQKESVETSLEALQEPSVTTETLQDNIYTFKTVSGDLEINGTYNRSTGELSYVSKLSVNEPVTVTLKPIAETN